ncbi:MAG: tRNA (pseudouridine(54)-N(1))-methyltransferase TrmY [Thermoplasmata archaeon]|jgi:tRNA (pseudouridine54-N1)-methyltransferase
MRRFLLLAHRVPPAGTFTLNDLAGGAGRMDEVARAVSTAFTLSNDLRRDTEFTVLFVAEPPPHARRVVLVGARLRNLNPDERSTAALLKNALVRSVGFPEEFESSPGLTVAAVDPVEELARFLGLPGAAWLSEDGRPIAEWTPPGGEVSAVLSDPYDPTPDEAARLRESAVPCLSVGPRSLRSSQVVDAVHRELDLREARPGPTVPG